MAVISKPSASAVKEVHILWLTAGLSCDGDSVSVTAAEQHIDGISAIQIQS